MQASLAFILHFWAVTDSAFGEDTLIRFVVSS